MLRSLCPSVPVLKIARVEFGLTSSAEIWIALWTEANEPGKEGLGSSTYLGVYAMFGAVALLSLGLGGMFV